MKKKIIIGIAALFLIIVIAVAIADQPSSEPTVAEPTSAEESTDSISAAEEDYFLMLTNINNVVGPAFTELGNLLQDAQIGNDQWTLHVAGQLVIIRSAYEEVMATTPPDSLIDIHLTYCQAMSHFNTATYLVSDGIDNLDADMLNEAAAEIDLGNELVNESTTLVIEFRASHAV